MSGSERDYRQGWRVTKRQASGADKRTAMWQPDSQVGMVVIKAPPVPKIKHPIPIIKSRFEDEDEEESTDSTLGSNESKDAGK